jgi:hypothetical protein
MSTAMRLSLRGYYVVGTELIRGGLDAVNDLDGTRTGDLVLGNPFEDDAET